jgi:hypothetical protein
MFGFSRTEAAPFRQADDNPGPAVLFDPLAVAPDWSMQDMGFWRHFLFTPTGRRLQARLLRVAYANAIQGCQDAMHTTHSAGKAAGFSECWQYLESLSRSASDSAETMNARTPEGEPSLREVLSP